MDEETSESTDSMDIFSDEILQYQRDIRENKWDSYSWRSLMSAIIQLPIESVRDIYEESALVFPTSAKFWKQYAEHEIQSGNNENAEKIFQRCLISCPDVELWRSYLVYLIEEKSKKVPNLNIFGAFELAIEKVGMDINSSQIWIDYITYVADYKSRDLNEIARKEMLRKLYQKAVTNPTHKIEEIWKEYNNFEYAWNDILAKALIAEHGPKYMAARTTYRERKNYLEGIARNMLAIPPGINPKHQQQVFLWKKLIAYEKGNPQRIEDEDLVKRVTYVYNQCLLYLYRYPEIWNEFAQYQVENKNYEYAKKIYTQGLCAVEDSFLLHFAYSNFLESLGNIEEAVEIYEKLLNKKDDTLVYIEYMRFARRSIDMKAAQKIFFRAKNSPNATYHLYIAAAKIEYHINGNYIAAKNIFQIGLPLFKKGDLDKYIIEYMQFLFDNNDKETIEDIFKKATHDFSEEETPEIWNTYLEFRRMQNKSVQNIKKKKKGIVNQIHRFKYMDLWPCSFEEINALTYEKKSSTNIKPNNSDRIVPDFSLLVDYPIEETPVAVDKFLKMLPKGNWDGPVIEAESIILLVMNANIE
eukprot:TRINITY_DN9037_c0_g1_i1.p1 TRINITY_DN9037_c0_g1~~TRINITY_DN9037_c0_g1_i1.p1  ORF type:complete len:583 (-),score=141.69 TRINITY_DN9037_c0_g1_i1:47-1795(-)